MKRYYVIVDALVVAGALLLHPPRPQAKPGLTLSDVPPPRGAAKGAPAGAVVDVVGALARSGVFDLRRCADSGAVAIAGGLTAQADPSGVNLAELVTDGEEIAVPLRGEETCRRTHRARRDKGRKTHKNRHIHRKVPLRRIDINTADATALQNLPGVGRGLAERLIDFRGQRPVSFD